MGAIIFHSGSTIIQGLKSPDGWREMSGTEAWEPAALGSALLPAAMAAEAAGRDDATAGPAECTEMDEREPSRTERVFTQRAFPRPCSSRVLQQDGEKTLQDACCCCCCCCCCNLRDC
ncbi:hypothetical protein INR49_007632 [Caranx melampygus]|nr:hypothetical protein INR49_007632 [Caranx melampygus]